MTVNYKTPDDPLAGTGQYQGTAAYGINDNGQIVGAYTDSNDAYHGFMYSNGKFTTLDDPMAATGPYHGTYAEGINDYGEIVGGYRDINSVDHGYFYNTTNTLRWTIP
jgi:probable HAF family extracellular repeat protein